MQPRVSVCCSVPGDMTPLLQPCAAANASSGTVVPLPHTQTQQQKQLQQWQQAVLPQPPIAVADRLFPPVCCHLLYYCSKTYVMSDELMDFLQDTVAKAPDLPPEGEPEAPKAKRQRCVCMCVCVCYLSAG